MSIFELREAIERSIPAWVIIIPFVLMIPLWLYVYLFDKKKTNPKEKARKNGNS